MTFEEFKSDWEKWNPIKTGQDLEICIDKYKNHLQVIEDNDYLEPIESLNCVISIDSYLQLLNSFFKFEGINNGEIIFLVLPSFKPEYQLRIADSELEISWLSEDLWENYYINPSIEVELKSKLLSPPNDKIELIRSEITKNLQQARPPKVNVGILDGIQYFFLYKANGNLKVGFKHSPLESSIIGRLISDIHRKIIPDVLFNEIGIEI